MATPSSSTTKAKPDSQNLSRSKSNISRKPKLPSSVSSDDGSSDQKPEKPLPNYLKPTISSRPDLVNSVKKKNNSVEDNQKLLRRRSFDRPPSSLTSPSTSSTRTQKSLNVSPSRSRDKPAVPREKPVIAQRSSSFHGSRGVPRGASSVKAPPVAPKKSVLGSSSSLKSKKEGSAIKKASEKEIPLDTASLSSAQEDEEEIIKVESDVKVASDIIEEPKDEKEGKEVQVEVVEAGEEVESGGPTTIVSPLVGDCIVIVAKEDEKEEEEVINEVRIEEKIEETKEQESNQDIKDDNEEEVKKETVDEVETPEKVDTEKKEVESVEETTEEKVEVVKEEVKEDKEVKEETEKVEEVQEEKVKEEEKEKAKEEEKKKREVVKGKKESPSAYNDVIASKMQENPRKNKVLALAGAFQTVIDYETAASK